MLRRSTNRQTISFHLLILLLGLHSFLLVTAQNQDGSTTQRVTNQSTVAGTTTQRVTNQSTVAGTAPPTPRGISTTILVTSDAPIRQSGVVSTPSNGTVPAVPGAPVQGSGSKEDESKTDAGKTQTSFNSVWKRQNDNSSDSSEDAKAAPTAASKPQVTIDASKQMKKTPPGEKTELRTPATVPPATVPPASVPPPAKPTEKADVSANEKATQGSSNAPGTGTDLTSDVELKKEASSAAAAIAATAARMSISRGDQCLPLAVNVQDLNILFSVPDINMLGNETSPFCPCTALPSWNWTNIDNWPLAFLRCPAGYRCSRRAYDAAVSSANSSHIAASITHAESSLDIKYGICVPCVIGEYCEAGTVELSSAQITECQIVGQQLAVEYAGTGKQSSTSHRRRLLEEPNKGGAARQFSAQCTSLRPCPPGTFCPNPGQLAQCSAGAFCSSTSTQPETCNITDALRSNPLLVLQDEPEFLYQRAANGRVSLGGNLCPVNASSPFLKCPPGSYCPNATAEIRCPARYYCPEGSSKPIHCGVLFDCPPGSSSPRIGWLGISSLVLLCLACIALVRVFSLRKARRLARQQYDDNLLMFMSSMGFRVTQRVDNYNYFNWNWMYTVPFCHKARAEAVISRSMSTRSISAAAPALQNQTSSKELLSSTTGPRVFASAAITPDIIISPSEEYGDINPKLTMSFENLSLELTSGSFVLRGVSGTFPHSQMHGVMGPSGCGKTSLMNTLCGKADYGIPSGSVQVLKMRGQGEPEVTTVKAVRHITGYVPQEDMVHTTLTVSENLMFAAKLRQPKDLNKEELRRITQIVLELLGLSHVETCIVGSMERRGISGGQRKRVNIGIELVAKPSLLCLDEPTSGLDAAVSHDIITALKEMAGKGMNVIMVVHQPRYSIFEMFHSVMLLGVGGRTVYLGPTNSALTYFQRVGFPLPPNENPADFYLDVISGAVKRRGDPDFVPDHLFDFWEAKGAGWLQKHVSQVDKQDSAGLDPSKTRRKRHHRTTGRMPASPELSAVTSQKAVVSHLSRGDLPWRPKDLQAISNHFNMLDINGDGYLSFEEFKEFWSGLSRMLNKEQYRAFLEQMIYDFEIDENGMITYDDFMSRMKARLVLLNNASLEEDEEMGLMDTMSLHSSMSISIFRDISKQKEMVDRLVQTKGREHHAPGHKRQKLASLVTSAQSNFSSRIHAIADMQAHRGWLRRICDGIKTEAHNAYAVMLGAHTGGRELPSLWRQVHIIFNRSFAKWLNNWDIMMSDMLLLALLGGLIALIQGNYSKISKLPPRIIMALTAFSVPISITGLRSFSFDNVIFLQRESQGGLCTVAYMLGRMLFDFVDMLVRPVMFMAFYYSIVWPRAQVKDYYIVLLAVAWYCYGFGYMTSVLFDKQFAMVAAAAVPLVLGAVINGNDPQPVAKVERYEPLWWLYGLSYARWGTEALMIKEALVGYVDPAQSPIIYGLFSTQGYCQLQKLNLTAAGHPTQPYANSTSPPGPQHNSPDFMDLARDRFIVEESKELGPLRGMLQFYQGYPTNLEDRCDSYFAVAVGWMFMLGLILRVLTVLMMKIKVMGGSQK